MSDPDGASAAKTAHHHHHKPWHIRANLMAGVLTAIPAIIVWMVLSFVFQLLGTVGQPLADLADRLAAGRLRPRSTWLNIR